MDEVPTKMNRRRDRGYSVVTLVVEFCEEYGLLERYCSIENIEHYRGHPDEAATWAKKVFACEGAKQEWLDKLQLLMAGGNSLREHVPYGRARGEEVEVNGRTIYFKSQVEVKFAGMLEALRQAGAIVTWEYEPKDFWFEGIRRGTCSYRPDFCVVWAQNREEIWYETKTPGNLTQKDVTKYRRMAQHYPAVKLVLVLSRAPSDGHSKSAVRQRIMTDKASRYLHHVTCLSDWKI